MPRHSGWRDQAMDEESGDDDGRRQRRAASPSTFYKRAKLLRSKGNTGSRDGGGGGGGTCSHSNEVEALAQQTGTENDPPPELRRNELWLCKLQEYREAGEASKQEGYANTPSQESLFAPTLVWRTFPLQQMAFDFVTTCSMPLTVYAFETETSTQGKRRFLVSNERFWWRYFRIPRRQRHFYELIREDSPCHLYLDLEYSREHNPTVDGVMLTLRLVTLLCRRLSHTYHVKCSPSDAIILDSTTPRKFSRHVTLRIPHVAFRNNRHVGAFVQRAVHDLHFAAASAECAERGAEMQEGSQLSDPCAGGAQDNDGGNACDRGCKGHSNRNSNTADSVASDRNDGCGVPMTCSSSSDCKGEGMDLKVRDEHGALVWFVDLGVYTRNRTFRLYLSSKRGKGAVLELAPACSSQITARQGTEAWHKEVFERSLVCNVEYTEDTRLLTCKGPNERDMRGCFHTAVSHCPNGGSSGAETNPYSALSDPRGDAASITQTIPTGEHRPTPYPAIDAHIAVAASRHAARPAAIRRWTYFPTSKVISYDISRARYCAHVGREHKSNGVYYVVNLMTGMFYQKCYDPDCRAAQFKSPDRHLPLSLLPFQHHAVLDEQAAPNTDSNGMSTGNGADGAGGGDGGVANDVNNDDGDHDDPDFLRAVDELCSAAEEGVLDHFV